MNKGFTKITLRALLLFGLVLGFRQPLPAQQSGGEAPEPLSLNEALRFALANSSSIKKARFDEYIAEAQVQGYTGIGLPQVKASVDGLFQKVVLPISFDLSAFGIENMDPPALPQWNLQGNLQVTQLVFDGSYIVGLRAARKFVELTEMSTDRSKLDITYAVSNAYYTALVSEARMKVLDNNIQMLQELYVNTKALYESGFIEKIDVDRLEINLANLETERTKIARLVALTRDLLKFQMGMEIERHIVLTDTINESEELPPLDEMGNADFSPENRMEYKLVSASIALQELNKKRYQSGIYPSVFAFGNLGTQSVGQDAKDEKFLRNWYPNHRIGLTLSYKIFDGFVNRSNIRQTDFQIEKLKLDQKDLESVFKLQVNKAQAEVLNAYNSLQSYKKTLNLAREVYDITRIKWEEGVGSNLEVLDAENTLRTSQSNYLSALYDLVLAKLELQKARGEILPPEVGIENNN